PRRFAQRAGGKKQSVAQAALVLDRDFEIPLKAVVLQTVVAQDEVAAGIGGAQGAGRGGAIGADPHRASGSLGKQQRLVADPLGLVADRDRPGRNVRPAVSAAEYARPQPLSPQGVAKRKDQRRFSRTSSCQVADDDY